MPGDLLGVALALTAVLVAGVIAFIVGYRYSDYRVRRQLKTASLTAEEILEKAKAQERELILEARDQALKIKTAGEAEVRQHRGELLRQERRIQHKEENLDRRLEGLDRRERAITEKEREADSIRTEAEKMRGRQRQELERIAGLSADEARGLLLKSIEEEVRADALRRVREIENDAREEAERRARKIVCMAIQRCSADQVADSTVSVVPLPNDEMKGRIIGREGRNIRALESATGIDLIIDDTPDAVTLSGFDPVRREVARLALQKLISDGRIHPARIEEVVQRAKQEIDEIVKEEGEQAASKTGVPGLHVELLKTLGRLRFRTSYGQNVLVHSIEVGNLGAVLAAEVGADVNTVRTAGLLHDIGKALSHEIEGPHALIGAELVRRYVKSSKIVTAIANHHAEMDQPQSIEAVLVQAADAISGARPGARRETVENYIKRLEALESVANSFAGVEKSFAIQAGREVRIIVKPDEIDDLAAVRLARDIVRRIEETLEYPGQIKVTVMRETRAVDYAK